MNQQPSVLVVDDESSILDTLPPYGYGKSNPGQPLCSPR